MTTDLYTEALQLLINEGEDVHLDGNDGITAPSSVRLTVLQGAKHACHLLEKAQQ